MIRVLIVDDIRLYREGLAYILAQHPGIVIAGAATDSEACVSALASCAPDLVLLRMSMPNSLDALRAMVGQAPGVKVVAIGVNDDESEVIACAEAGMAGYLLRDGSMDDLVSTIEAAARGEALCSPRVTATLLRRVATLAAKQRSWRVQARLSPRETEILRYVDEGLSNKEIARRLSIDVRTVKNHVHNILEKLQVHRRGEAAALMRGAHLTPVRQ